MQRRKAALESVPLKSFGPAERGCPSRNPLAISKSTQFRALITQSWRCGRDTRAPFDVSNLARARCRSAGLRPGALGLFHHRAVLEAGVPPP